MHHRAKRGGAVPDDFNLVIAHQTILIYDYLC